MSDFVYEGVSRWGYKRVSEGVGELVRGCMMSK